MQVTLLQNHKVLEGREDVVILMVQIQNQVSLAIHWFQQPYLHIKVFKVAGFHIEGGVP
jgi:hypothetical protein